MDSIDVYLEKKRKRMEGFNQSVKKAKVSDGKKIKKGSIDFGAPKLLFLLL